MPALDQTDFRGLSQRLGLRRCAWLGWHFARRPAEKPGPHRNSDMILSYSRHARRGGTFLGVDAEGMPRWLGGTPLPAPTDEWPWCAYFASASLLAVLRPEDLPPFGLRAAVADICADARKSGTLVIVKENPSYQPRPGDLVAWKRKGRNPLTGGWGHLATVIMPRGVRRADTIGGNERNTIGHVVSRDLSDAVAFIRGEVPA